MDRAWAVSPLDRCPVCESYIVYANLRRKEKVFYCGTVTQEDEIVRPCSKQSDGEPWESNMQYISTFDPPTVLALLNELERLRREWEVLAAALKHVFTCDDCECATCPEGTGLLYRAYRALGGAQAIGKPQLRRPEPEAATGRVET